MRPPRTPPPHGLSLPIHWRRVIDGDTIEAPLPSGRSFILRIDGYDAPEKRSAGGLAAAHALESLLEESRECTMWLSLPEDKDKDGRLDLDEMLHHFLVIGERVRGTLFADSSRVDIWMIDHGHVS